MSAANAHEIGPLSFKLITSRPWSLGNDLKCFIQGLARTQRDLTTLFRWKLGLLKLIFCQRPNRRTLYWNMEIGKNYG